MRGCGQDEVPALDHAEAKGYKDLGEAIYAGDLKVQE